MAAFGYSFPWVVVDRVSNQLAADRNDGALLDPTTRQPVPTFDQLGYALDFVLRRAADRFTREQAQHAADSAIARVYGSFDGLADDEDRSA